MLSSTYPRLIIQENVETPIFSGTRKMIKMIQGQHHIYVNVYRRVYIYILFKHMDIIGYTLRNNHVC